MWTSPERKDPSFTRSGRLVILGLGANVRGRFGTPAQTLARAMALLEEAGVKIVAVSRLYRCRPYGGVPQPDFLNLVALARTDLSAGALLRSIRRIENAAGRRRGRAWGPRALDVDVLDMRGIVMRPVGMGGRGGGRRAHAWQRRGIVLPHPGLSARAFVLMPLCDVAPWWRFSLPAARARHLKARLAARTLRSCRPLSTPFRAKVVTRAATS